MCVTMKLVLYSAVNPDGEEVKRIGIDDGEIKKPLYPTVSKEYAVNNCDYILNNAVKMQGDYGMYWYVDLKVTEEVIGEA